MPNLWYYAAYSSLADVVGLRRRALADFERTAAAAQVPCCGAHVLSASAVLRHGSFFLLLVWSVFGRVTAGARLPVGGLSSQGQKQPCLLGCQKVRVFVTLRMWLLHYCRRSACGHDSSSVTAFYPQSHIS